MFNGQIEEATQGMGWCGPRGRRKPGTWSQANQHVVWVIILSPGPDVSLLSFFSRGWSGLFVLVSECSALSSGGHKEEKEE